MAIMQEGKRLEHILRQAGVRLCPAFHPYNGLTDQCGFQASASANLSVGFSAAWQRCCVSCSAGHGRAFCIHLRCRPDGPIRLSCLMDELTV